MIVAQEQALRKEQTSWITHEPAWAESSEPERDHPGVEPDEIINNFTICKESLDMLPTIKGIRIPTPIFNFSMDDISAVLEVVNSDGWSDDDSRASTTPAMLQDSIRSIRDEASRMDSILALDKLDTLTEELLTIKRELESQSTEMAQQRETIKLKDKRIAMLELERDLYKADNAKLKQDLNSILAQFRNNSDISSVTDVPSLSESDQSVDLERFDSQGTAKGPAFELDGYHYSAGHPKRTTHDYSGLTTFSHTKDAISPQLLARYMTSSNAGKPQSFEGVCASSSRLRKSCSRMLLKLVAQRQAAVCSTATLLPPCSTGSTLGALSFCSSEGLSIESQVRNLHGRLKCSMDLCDELRKRLARVGHYYGRMIHRLQSRLERVTIDKKEKMIELAFHSTTEAGIDRQRNVNGRDTKLHQT